MSGRLGCGGVEAGDRRPVIGGCHRAWQGKASAPPAPGHLIQSLPLQMFRGQTVYAERRLGAAGRPLLRIGGLPLCIVHQALLLLVSLKQDGNPVRQFVPVERF
jgi:hypothetical protein